VSAGAGRRWGAGEAGEGGEHLHGTACVATLQFDVLLLPLCYLRLLCTAGARFALLLLLRYAAHRSVKGDRLLHSTDVCAHLAGAIGAATPRLLVTGDFTLPLGKCLLLCARGHLYYYCRYDLRLLHCPWTERKY
jgi:hypothetical protein